MCVVRYKYHPVVICIRLIIWISAKTIDFKRTRRYRYNRFISYLVCKNNFEK